MLEATLPRPERDGIARPPHRRRGRRARAPRAASARLVITHISDELDERLRAPRGRGGLRRRASLVAARGRRLRDLMARRAPCLTPRRVRSTACRSATSSRTSSACGARWTSCSATSSTAPGSRPRGAAASRPRSTSSTRATRRARSSTPSSPGSTPTRSALEIEGRELIIAGHRRPAEAEGRVYQQLEIDFGPVPARDPARRRRRRRAGAARPTATASCASSCRSCRRPRR